MIAGDDEVEATAPEWDDITRMAVVALIWIVVVFAGLVGALILAIRKGVFGG